MLIYSPDRLSRRYAYQILLAEELARCGVELIYLKSPAGATSEDQLVVQFQGMIAEYERAQIAERSRRGKRHKAQQGTVNVLSGAPYGYRYVRKSESSSAYYEVIETEAQAVRMVFEVYTQQRLSINAIARMLNEHRVADRFIEAGCYATQPIAGRPAMGKQNSVHASASPSRCDSAMELLAGTVRATNSSRMKS